MLAWLNEEMNYPGRLEHYVMQVCQTLVNGFKGFANDKSETPLDRFKVRFVTDGEDPEPEMTVEEATRISKAKWG